MPPTKVLLHRTIRSAAAQPLPVSFENVRRCGLVNLIDAMCRRIEEKGGKAKAKPAGKHAAEPAPKTRARKAG